MEIQHKLMLLGVFLLWRRECQSTQLFNNIEPSACGLNQYFQFSSLTCVACGEFQQRSPDLVSCTCQPGAKLVSYFGGPVKTCQPCAPPKVVTNDGWECSDCPTGRPYDSTLKKCASCVSPLQHQTDRTETGALLIRKTCLQCQSDTSPSTNEGVCRRCHSQVLKVTGGASCACPTDDVFTGGVCLSRTSGIPADDTTSYIIRHKNNFMSAYFKEYFRAAKVLCQENQNFTACQQLGNLCVMLMYNEDNSNRAATDACKEYLILVRASTDYVDGITDWPRNMPWLYYKDDGSTVVLEKENVPQAFTRGEILKFNLVSYRVNGSFLDIRKDPSILQLCPQPMSMTEKAFTMTNQYSIKCQMSIAKLLQQDTVFFDMFLRVDNDKSQYPVPVLVDNVQTRGTFVNRDTERKNWKLNRRFFLIDKYSGLGKIDDSVPSFIQYASSIELNFQLIDNGKFYPPLLKIHYDVHDVDPVTMETDLVNIEFKVTYTMDTSQLDENIKITVGVLSALGVVYALVKISSWRRREGIAVLDCTSCMLFIVYVSSALALVFLAVIFVTCIQWQFFFKRQSTVIRVLPTADQEHLIASLLVAAFVMKFFDVVYILYSQIYVDIFFIDWERPRGSQVTGTDGRTVTTPVSVMRTLFVANEWREIQTIRRIKPTFQVILVVLFLQGFGFQYWATTDPVNRLSVDRNIDYVGETNLCLRIAVVSLLYFVIAIIQWIIYGFLYERFVGDAIGDFIDFCSMSNISVFVMSQRQYGHYIHGRSVHGRSDTSLYELYEQFQREEDNLCGKRGLEPNSERQTFEMGITVRFRNEYSKILQPLLSRETQGARRGQQNMSRQNPNLPGSNLTPALERSVKAYNQMNRYLSSFVEHAIRENDYFVKDKLLLEKLLKNELQPPEDKSVFYNDDGRSFTSILLYGQEWSLLLFNLLLFLIVDWLSGWNAILAGFIAYMAEIIITSVRDSFGKKNLAAKTMVDERFLI